ncbi:MAG: hypothetical protein IJT69_02505 [Clostridia bacterium]|nr:hypothetical protein [Clostridia bacterium]
MAIKFLTPVQLWQDFDPLAAPLDISIEYNTETAGARVKGAYFTAVAEDGESVRAFAEVKSAVAAPKKAILCVMNSGDQAAYAEGFDELLKRGFAVMTLDVSGVPDEFGRATHYSDGYAYASFAAGVPDRFLAAPSAKNSPVYLWAKIARRAITLLDYFYPKAKVAVMGAKTAADVAWQVAASDSRVSALVALLGDYSEPPVPEDGDSSNADSYVMSISAKSAARLVKCPCLLATASNLHGGDVEKLNEVASQIPASNDFALVITPRLNAQIDADDLLATYKWLDRTMKGEDSPQLALTSLLEDGALSFSLAGEGKAQSATLHFSYNHTRPEYRHWHEVPMKKHEDGSFSATVPVWEGDREIYAYATAAFSGGLTFASRALDTLVTSPVPYRMSQFLLDTESDHGFYADNSAETFVAFKKDFSVSASPDGVPGFCGKGVLRTNILSERGRYEPAAALHISVYSAEEGEVRVVLVKEEEGVLVDYAATCYVEAEEWTRLSLKTDDFKTAELIPMKDWDDLYGIILPDTVDKYYNNFLWM